MKMKYPFFIYVNFSEETNPPQDYKYWFFLIDHFIKSADFLKFHIWNEEVEVIEELSLKTDLERVSLHPLEMVCFQGDINQKLTNYILNESLNQLGNIKWFSLFLEHNGEVIFESSHWGSEINIMNPDKNEIEIFKNILPWNATFHDFNEKQSD